MIKLDGEPALFSIKLGLRSNARMPRLTLLQAVC